MKITFLGATEEVTGSMNLIEEKNTKILVDCGLFQDKKLRSQNWRRLPVEPSSIDAIVLTHAHIDHTGYIPRLVKNGFRGAIYCSKATYKLSSILLLDSGRLHEKETDGLPLYTEEDAARSLRFFKVIDYDAIVSVGDLEINLIRSGHIIGSSFVVVSNGKKTITFSGDLGRPHPLIMKSPPHVKKTDFLVIESTYGDTLHEQGDPIKELGRIVNETVAQGGILIIPAFSVARTQDILYCLYRLKEKNAIPKIPIFLDSPMAIRVTDLFCDFTEELSLSQHLCDDIFDIATDTPTVQQSKRLDKLKRSAIIIAGSGMATGGRVLHHFKHFISDDKNTILFVGYQAEDTEGRALVEGAKEITIYDKRYKVRAKIKTINTLSAHADYNEILEWLSYFKTTPQKVFVTHGEKEASNSLKEKIKERFGWTVIIPKYSESFELD